ncbi:MAG: TonB-dependent receptor [Dysgonamonadaceae bacterium]|jgi:outer membrane cobalamin receptor|nr:TonB-dependent receptor [Dysgonamonadaceae bacterium]
MSLDRALHLCFLLLLQTPTIAQGKTDSIRQLDEVTVVARRNRYREVIPSQRLSGKRLEALSSFSVADAIRYFSGVQIKDYGGVGGLKTVDIRSMGTHHLGVFYDGIQLGNAQNGQIDLGKFSLDNIEEISLYNGQKSEIFQSAKDFGSAGTVYLRTRRPRFIGSKNHNLISRFRVGSFDLVNPSVLWEWKITENVSSSINAEYVYSSGKYPFRYRKILSDKTVAWDTAAIRQNGDIHSLRLEGGLNGHTAGNGRWHGKIYFYDSEKGIPGAIVNNVWKRSQRQWDRNFFAQFSAENPFPLPPKYEMLLNIKYADDRMRYLNPDTTLMYLDNRFLQREIYASLANKYTVMENWDVSFSADYQWNALRSDLKNFIFPVRNTALAALATAFEAGQFKAQASVLGTFVFENVAHVKDKREYTPAVFLSCKPLKNENLNIRAFYKRIFRMPTFNDLYYTDVGNIALNPEYTVQYNAGLHYEENFATGAVAHLNIRADAYYSEVTDKITAIPKGNGQFRWMMMNLGYVEIRGADVSAQTGWRLPAGILLNTGLSYTRQEAQDFTDPASPWYGGQIAYIPRHSGSVTANGIWKTWDLNYGFIYVGERYHHSANIRENYEQPWYTHDLTVGKTIGFGKVKTRLSVEINNILNQQYDVVLNYPMPGRHFKIVLKVEM